MQTKSITQSPSWQRTQERFSTPFRRTFLWKRWCNKSRVRFRSTAVQTDLECCSNFSGDKCTCLLKWDCGSRSASRFESMLNFIMADSIRADARHIHSVNKFSMNSQWINGLSSVCRWSLGTNTPGLIAGKWSIVPSAYPMDHVPSTSPQALTNSKPALSMS